MNYQVTSFDYLSIKNGIVRVLFACDWKPRPTVGPSYPAAWSNYIYRQEVGVAGKLQANKG